MDLQLTGKRVLVTGGTRGIGRAIVGAFLTGVGRGRCGDDARAGLRQGAVVQDLRVHPQIGAPPDRQPLGRQAGKAGLAIQHDDAGIAARGKAPVPQAPSGGHDKRRADIVQGNGMGRAKRRDRGNRRPIP